ncbi:hypothetical protein [Herbiconiux daphne]|uniref:Transmembrane protein n=1 Tax=Herbiconiux daphne TaxID=2970914 RepID=A0ABT2H858_9MICO|nr:hypothetical protein [Herbiconiux daphne]MCS5736113.1 hypothetical protein [Herbiconiux daphne]
MKYRITSAQGKVVYIVFGYFAVVALAALAGAVGGGAVGAPVAVGLLWLWIVLGGRMFRGEDEPVAPPRAWWRLTSGPTAGFVIAALFAVQAIGSGVSAGAAAGAGAGAAAAAGAAGVTAAGGAPLTLVAAGVASAVAAVAYVNSSIRLSSRAPRRA